MRELKFEKDFNDGKKTENYISNVYQVIKTYEK